MRERFTGFLRSVGERAAGLLKRRSPRPSAEKGGRTELKGGRLYSLWLLVLPVLMGLTLGWFASVLLGVLLSSGGPALPEAGAPAVSAEQEAIGIQGMESFLTANPFRASPMTVVPDRARSDDVVITGSLATAVLQGTLPDTGAWLEDKGKVRLVLVGSSFDVYTLKKVTYRNATFEKDGETVVKELLYSGGGTGGERLPVAREGGGDNVPVGDVVPAKPGEQDGEVPSGLVNDLVQNPFNELKKVRLRPSKDGDAGLEIQWIQDDSILKQLGVQKGDVIKSVNGIPFTNMADIANSINSLMNSERFDVEVQRGGKSTSLRYVVR